MKVLVAGGGNVGRYLARILVRAGHEVTVIDLDEARLDRVREESGATVVHGDATEPSLLERSAIRVMDVVVAVTGHDEDNLVVSSLAKFEFGVPQVVGRVKNASNAWLYEPDMGVDVLVSAPHTIAQLIEEQVAVGDVVELLQLPGGQAALLEATLPEDSPVVGSVVSDVAWPPDCVPAVVIRGTRVLPAPSETVLQVGDRVLCVTDVAQMQPLHRLLGTVAPHR
ncbi:MAG TPA: TrkA family potassium uptake protein [Solirubrobacteraceae bacterium]